MLAQPAPPSEVQCDSLQVVDFWSDLGCPWASLAVHRFRETREKLGLNGRVVLRHRTFPLELINSQGTPKSAIDAEVELLAGREPGLQWQTWTNDEWLYPGSFLLPLEAVRAAQANDVGGLQASEDLDAALRHAFYADSRPIGLYSEILAVAEECASIDVPALAASLQHGTARATLFKDLALWRRVGIIGSPHLVFPGHFSVHNPGLSIRWDEDPSGEWHVAVTADKPDAYETLFESFLTHGESFAS